MDEAEKTKTQKALDYVNGVRAKWFSFATLHVKPAWFLYGAICGMIATKAFL